MGMLNVFGWGWGKPQGKKGGCVAGLGQIKLEDQCDQKPERHNKTKQKDIM